MILEILSKTIKRRLNDFYLIIINYYNNYLILWQDRRLIEMDDKSKKEIILDSINIVENLVTPFEPSSGQYRYCKSSDLCFFVEGYEGPYNRLYGKILAKLKADHHISVGAFSKERIFEFIDKTIGEIVKNTDIIIKTPLIVDFFDEYFHEHEVYLFLEGLEISVEEPIQLGKVKLSKIDRKMLELLSKDHMFKMMVEDFREVNGRNLKQIFMERPMPQLKLLVMITLSQDRSRSVMIS